MGAGAELRSLGLQARTWTLWALFKAVQAVVAASFSFIIVVQAALKGVGRLIGGEPPELLKVQAAQAALRERRAAATTASSSAQPSSEEAGKPGMGPGTIHLRAVAADSLSAIKPMLVFNEPEQGACVGARVWLGRGGTGLWLQPGRAAGQASGCALMRHAAL
jgi:hypothetical protein